MERFKWLCEAMFSLLRPLAVYSCLTLAKCFIVEVDGWLMYQEICLPFRLLRMIGQISSLSSQLGVSVCRWLSGRHQYWKPRRSAELWAPMSEEMYL